MKKMNLKLSSVIAVLMVGLLLAACNKNDETQSTGKLTIQLTDAPFPSDLVDEANVSISKIEIRKANNSENEENGSPFITLSEEELSFNLLDLTNGVTANLVNLEIESGSYNLVRLYVSEASVKLTDGRVFDLSIPSSAKSGIKIFINPAIEVAGSLSSDLLLDFDVSNSFVVQGDIDSAEGIKGFSFKPVIKASNLSTTGRLTGIVSDTSNVGINGIQVSVLAADTVYTTSFTDETGGYTILGIDAGLYQVQFDGSNFITVTKENIEIVAGNATTQNAILIAD